MTDTATLDHPLDEREAPLVRRLAAMPGAGWVDEASHADFCARPGDQMLFFTGDPVRFPECLDVAVVLPELQRALPGRFGVGVVRRGDEAGRRASFVVGPKVLSLLLQLTCALVEKSATRAPGCSPWIAAPSPSSSTASTSSNGTAARSRICWGSCGNCLCR